MLYLNETSQGPCHRIFALLVFVFLIITNHNIVSADSKEDLAKQLRDQGYEKQQRGDIFSALKYYSQVIELGLDDPVVYNDVGVLYEQLGIPQKAEKHYLQALQIDKHYLPAYSNLAYFYKTHGRNDLAFEYFKKRFTLAEPSDSWAQKAKEEMLKIRPNYLVWFQQLEAQDMENQIIEDARVEFIEKVTRSNQHFKKGEEYVKLNKLDRAVKEFDQALSLTPENPKIVKAREKVINELTAQKIRRRADLAIQKLNSGDTYSAKREIQRALTTFPKKSE